MNVSVLKKKKFVFYIIYAFWMRNTFYFLSFGPRAPPYSHSSVEMSDCLCKVL